MNWANERPVQLMTRAVPGWGRLTYGPYVVSPRLHSPLAYRGADGDIPVSRLRSPWQSAVAGTSYNIAHLGEWLRSDQYGAARAR